MFKLRFPNSAVFRWTVITVLGLVAVCATYLELRGLFKANFLQYDYAFFYYAFHAVLFHSPTVLYNAPAEQQFLTTLHFHVNPHNQYVYPPEFALFWSFLGLLPFHASAFLWIAISVTAYGAGLTMIIRMLWPRITRNKALPMALVAMMLTPVQIDIGAGNVDCILFAAIVLTFYLLHRHRKPWLAGMPLGLAIAFKVTPMAVLVYLLLRKQWRTAASAAVMTSALVFITILFTGTHVTWRYLGRFLSFGQASMKNGPAPYNESLYGVIGLFQHHGALHVSTQLQSIIFMTFAGFVALAILYVVRCKNLHWTTDFALASLTPLMFSPLVEQMHMVFALPALLVLTRNVHAELSRHGRSLTWTSSIFGLIASCSFLALSLPMTFLLNFLVSHWPHLYWAQTEMFWVLVCLFLATVWQGQRGALKQNQSRDEFAFVD